MKHLLLSIFFIFSAGTAVAQGVCEETSVVIEGDWGSAAFDVQLAIDAEKRAQGLMFVEAMPSREGMLFLYPNPQTVTFWMKNTLIPLDMLFFDENGILAYIHENAVPQDLTMIPSGQGILGVLEVNGGLVSAYGISLGTKIYHPHFSETTSWPCEVK